MSLLLIKQEIICKIKVNKEKRKVVYGDRQN